MPKHVITQKLRDQVGALRDEGWSSREIAEITGVSQRTVIRACHPPLPKTCASRGCHNPANPHGRFCVQHSKERMGGRAGNGPRQEQVLRVVKKHGLVSAEQLRNETGLNSTNLGQVTVRLLRLGILERPVRGYYRLAGARPLNPIDGPDEDEIERLADIALETLRQHQQSQANLARTK